LLIVTIGIIIFMSVPPAPSTPAAVPACPNCVDTGCDSCGTKPSKKHKDHGRRRRCRVCYQDPCQCPDHGLDSQPADYSASCSTGRW
jgi:hypothetical protein